MRTRSPGGRDNASHRCRTPPQLGSPVFILTLSSAAGPARQPGDCPLCPREEIVSTDFEEKILLIFVTRGNTSPHITGQTGWRLRSKGGTGDEQIDKQGGGGARRCFGGGGGEEMHSCKFVTVGRSVRLSRHLHTSCQPAPQRRLSGC